MKKWGQVLQSHISHSGEETHTHCYLILATGSVTGVFRGDAIGWRVWNGAARSVKKPGAADGEAVWNGINPPGTRATERVLERVLRRDALDLKSR